jgi:hypothetical protein
MNSTTEQLMKQLHTRSYTYEGDTVLVIGTREGIEQETYTEVEFVFDSTNRLCHIGVLNTREDVSLAKTKAAPPCNRYSGL